MLSDCGVDWIHVERDCSDRDGWEQCVNERKRYLDKWERPQGHIYVWDWMRFLLKGVKEE